MCREQARRGMRVSSRHACFKQTSVRFCAGGAGQAAGCGQACPGQADPPTATASGSSSSIHRGMRGCAPPGRALHKGHMAVCKQQHRQGLNPQAAIAGKDGAGVICTGRRRRRRQRRARQNNLGWVGGCKRSSGLCMLQQPTSPLPSSQCHPTPPHAQPSLPLTFAGANDAAAV